MGTSIYSFGEDSPIKFEISDRLAELYNQAAERYFKAQQRFNQKVGRQWDPVTDPIEIGWNRRQRKAWNEFGKIFNSVVEAKGPFHENDIMDDYLVRNTVETVVSGVVLVGVAIAWAAIAGATWETLRRS